MPLRDTWAAWLGPAADTVTDDQLDRLAAASAAIAARWPDPDLADDREHALSTAAQVVLGDTTLEVAAEEWHAACAKTHAAHTALTGALIASSTGTRSGPGSEADLVHRSGASRLTVRKALGR